MTSLLKNAAQGGGGRPGGPLAAHARSRNAELLEALFGDGTNQAAFLCRSFIYERARGELKYRIFTSPPRADHQKSAHLHCLYGVPMLYAHPGARRAARAAGKMRPFACSKVYDLRQYTRNTLWGPFVDDGSGRVDWEKAEAIMIVLGANLRLLGLNKFPICRNVWDTPFPGVWPNSYRPLSAAAVPGYCRRHRHHHPRGEGSDGEVDAAPERAREEEEEGEEEEEDQDPYGVSGTWLRVVCFLDYTDFFAYNFNAENQPPPNVPRPAVDVGEATRLILMKLHVTGVEPPGPGDGQALPVVHFRGISRSLDDSWDENANSNLRGMGGIRGALPYLPSSSSSSSSSSSCAEYIYIFSTPWLDFVFSQS